MRKERLILAAMLAVALGAGCATEPKEADGAAADETGDVPAPPPDPLPPPPPPPPPQGGGERVGDTTRTPD